MKEGSLSVIIPARNAETTMARCLSALAASSLRPSEIVVVDDASRDATAAVAASFPGVRVLRQDRPGNASIARNRGVAATTGDMLVFVDADVEVGPDALAVMAGRLPDGEWQGVFGGYDDEPACGNWSSLYKNLAHHFIHARSAGPSSSFWTGCGALRREAFVRAGGFDETGRYEGIEDVELGHRLALQGCRVLLDSGVEVKHLKRWTFAGWLRADFFLRARPWVRLLCDSRSALPHGLNFRWSDRISILAAWALLPAVLLGLGGFRVGWLAALAALGIWLAANARFLRFCAARKGPVFAAFAAGSHLIHHLAASAPFVFFYLPWRVVRRGKLDSAGFPPTPRREGP